MRWNAIDNRKRDGSRSEAAANAMLAANAVQPALMNERPALTLENSVTGSIHDSSTWDLVPKEHAQCNAF